MRYPTIRRLVTDRSRLDVELVTRQLARSRVQASELIANQRVTVDGRLARKPSALVTDLSAIEVSGGNDYVSRGAHKLVGALDAFQPEGLVVAGRTCLDAGACTGGFTEVLLRRGAASVVALDVGHGQLAPSLRDDARVIVMDHTNVRDLVIGMLPGHVDLVVADLSFVSLTLALGPMLACTQPDADAVVMVKPQFEVGKQRLGAGGVVRQPQLRSEAIHTVAENAWGLGWGSRAVIASPLPGPSGNVEYFLWLSRSAARLAASAATQAVAAGPQ